MAYSKIAVNEMNKDIVSQFDEVYVNFNKLSLIEDKTLLNQRYKALYDQLYELCDKYAAISSDYLLGIFMKVDKDSYFTNAILNCFGRMIAHNKNRDVLCYTLGYLMFVGYLPDRVILSPCGMTEYTMSAFFNSGLEAGDFRCEEFVEICNVLSTNTEYMTSDSLYEHFVKLYDLCQKTKRWELYFETLKVYRRFIRKDAQVYRYLPIPSKSNRSKADISKLASIVVWLDGCFLENEVYSWLVNSPNVYMTKKFRKIAEYYRDNFEIKRKEYYDRNFRKVLINTIINVIFKVICPLLAVILWHMFSLGLLSSIYSLIFIGASLIGYFAIDSYVIDAYRIIHWVGTRESDKKDAYNRLLFYPDVFIPGFENIDYTDMERDDVRKLC